MQDDKKTADPIESSNKQRSDFDSVITGVILEAIDSGKYKTVEEISQDTGVDIQEVTKIVNRLISKGIVLSGDVFSFEESRRGAIEDVLLYLRSLKKLKKFDHTAENPVLSYEGKFKTNEYNADEFRENYGEFIDSVDESEYLRVMVHERGLVYVYTEGPRIGQIHYHKDLKPIKEDEKVLSFEEVHDRIDAFVIRIDTEKDNQDAFTDFVLGLELMYYGFDNEVGLNDTQYYSIINGDRRLVDLITEIKKLGYRKFAEERLKQLGLNTSKIPLAISGVSLKRIHDFFHSGGENKHDVRMRHQTYSSVLPNITQLRGLASKDHFEELGIKKRYGGESGGAGAYTPSSISFWYTESQVDLSGGYGPRRPFEYPILFGVSETNSNKLRLTWGSMDLQQEVTVRGYVPLEYIDVVYVPGFMRKEVESMFKFNSINTQVDFL